MPVIYIDADACPVKDETYRVAKRYALRVVVVANSHLGVPADPLVELVVQVGFGAADDWIAVTIQPGDICITVDVPLAARCVAAGAVVVDHKGKKLTADTIGEALGMRDLMTDLREAGTARGGPRPMTAKDRSKFLATLDEVVNKQKRLYA